MFFPLPKGLKLTPEHKRLLQSLTFDEHGPGTILHDFEALLSFIKEKELPVTPAQQLPLRSVTEINVRLAHPLQLGLKRAQQKSYPPIHGLYLVVRASGLTLVGGTGQKPVLEVDEETYRRWTGLNPAEKYGSLLEAWLLRGRPEIIGERAFGYFVPENFYAAGSFYFEIPPGDGLAVAGNRDVEDRVKYHPGWHNLGLLSLFGLLDIQQGMSEPGQGWRIERVRRTPFGDALLTALHVDFFEDIDHIFELEDEGKIPFGVLQRVLQPYLPAWKNSLSIPEQAFRAGTYSFKVSLGSWWCRIVIGAKQDLDSLASTILKAVDFDSDHLYEFSFQNRLGHRQSVQHPEMDEGPFTSEVRVGDLPLRVGQHMTYLFDFGDNWEFDVALEQVNPDQTTQKTRILEKHGQPPQQYPNWEE